MTPDTILHGDCTNVMRRIADRIGRFRPDRPAVSLQLPFAATARPSATIARETGSIRPSGTSTASETGQLLRQLLRLAQGGRIHRRLAQGRLPARRAYRLPEALRLIDPVPAEHARTGLSAGQGRAGRAGTPDPGRAGLALHRQQAAPDAEAGRFPKTPHRGALPRRRPGASTRSAVPVPHWSRRGKAGGGLSASSLTGGITARRSGG